MRQVCWKYDMRNMCKKYQIFEQIQLYKNLFNKEINLMSHLMLIKLHNEKY